MLLTNHAPNVPSRGARSASWAGARTVLAALAWAAAAMGARPADARGQIANPVFVDDSPAAAEGLEQAQRMLAAGNVDEAVRTLQGLLETEGDRLLADEADPQRYISARRAIHEALLASPLLLERYRRLEGPVASAMLAGDLDERDALEAAREVERTRLLTQAGFEAALRVAQRHLERARFDAAIHTLAQLDRHPDREPGAPLAAAALELLTLTLRYVDRPSAAELALRWRTEAEIAAAEPGDAAPRIDGPPIVRGLSPLDHGPAVDLAEIVAQPLRSNDLTPLFPDASEDEDDRRGGGGRARRRPPPSLHVLPVVAGDTIYVNDGLTIRAWDRFTLTSRWMWAPLDYNLEGAEMTSRRARGGSLLVQDVATLAVEGDWVVAATGLSVQGTASRVGDPRVHGLDALTGVERWATTVESLHPDLQRAEIRGPALIDQGTVIVTAWKEVRERRLLSAYLIGLDLATGRARWIRLLGSAGALPYSQSNLTTERNTAHQGVVYRLDRLGVVSAIESATGRPRWVRRFNVEINRSAAGRPWQIDGPVIVGERLYALTPDRDRLLVLDARSGTLLGERDGAQLGSPQYLLSAGDRLILVGVASVSVMEASAALNADASPARVLSSDVGPFVGRAALAGDRILAPTSDGILAATLDPGQPQAMRVELDHSGNLLALASQLIVADDQQVHSYLIWEVAQRMLRERMGADPADPAPAATYAELAFRSGRTDLVIEAVDAAARAVERDPLAEQNQRARRRLFQSVLSMVEPAQRADEPRLLSGEVRRGLLDRLGRLAASPGERVAHLLALAEFHEAERQPGRAVQAYQTILVDAALAAVAHERRNGMTISARLEATRRLQGVVERFGPAVYAVYAQEAQRALAQLGPASPPAAFEELATRYPAAPAAAEALLSAARRRMDEGRAPSALANLQAAHDIARVAVADPFDTLVSEAAGRLVAALIEANHPEPALATLDRISAAQPGLRLTVNGETLPVDSLRQRALALSRALAALPRVGALTDDAFSLEGWRLHRPLTRAPGARSDVLLLESDQHLALWMMGADGKPRRLWTLPAAGERVLALRLSRESLLVARRTSRGWSVERRLLDRGGALDWATRPFEAVFADLPVQGTGATVDVGPGEPRLTDEMLFGVGASTLVLADRTGRTAAFDLDTGQTRWRSRPVRALADLIVGAERIVLAGLGSLEDAATGDDTQPVVLSLDPASGRRQLTIEPPLGDVRWTRLDHAENIILGMTRGTASFDPRAEATRWSAQAAENASPIDAWIVGGALVLLGEDGRFRLRSTFDGEGPEAPLQVADVDQEAAVARASGVVVRWVGERLLLSSARGASLYTRAGELSGRVGGSMAPPFLPATVAADRALLVSLQPVGFRPEEQGRRYTLFSVDLRSAALLERRSVVLEERPLELEAIDGAVALATRTGVVLIAAPPADDE